MKSGRNAPLVRKPAYLLFSFACLWAFWPNPAHGARVKPEADGEKLRFKPEHGFYSKPFELSITPGTPGIKVLFTTNGSIPSIESGAVYQKPIAITSTTIFRARTIVDGKVGSVQTRTFIFAADIMRQSGAGFPKTWGTNEGKPVPAHYGMNSNVVFASAYHDSFEPALKAIPTLSVVMDPADLFDSSRGIYANAKETGSDSERAASVELISAEGTGGFEIDCGIRIQGGWNRRAEESPKHSFRLLFKRKYGVALLKYPLFGDTGVREFETLILRGGNNNSWLHWSGEERRRADFVRDQWMRDTVRVMGHPSARGLFVHLYLNGLYWGLYNVCERPSAPFAAANLGGAARDYDSRNADKILEGDDLAWKQMFTLANGGLAGDDAFKSIQELLDIPSFIDYMIANLYGANADWDRSSNWYAARRRHPAGTFHFFVWDGERTLEKLSDNTIGFDDDQSPPRLFQKLRQNAEFRLQFADRLKRHLTNGGCLTPEAAANRFSQLARSIEEAVIAESARWGNYRRDVHPYKTGPYESYTRNEHWRPEIQRLLTEYFPQRSKVVLDQFRSVGLFPAIDPPQIK